MFRPRSDVGDFIALDPTLTFQALDQIERKLFLVQSGFEEYTPAEKLLFVLINSHLGCGPYPMDPPEEVMASAEIEERLAAGDLGAWALWCRCVRPELMEIAEKAFEREPAEDMVGWVLQEVRETMMGKESSARMQKYALWLIRKEVLDRSAETV
jgi:hypothetical protein